MPLKAFITAGGKSTRFMEDKSLHIFEGRPLIQTVYEKISAAVSDISIISNDPEKYSFFKCPVYADIIPDIGPIGGLYTALKNAGKSRVFLFPCDMPFLNTEFIRYMSRLPDYYDAIVPALYGMYEPLHAIYSSACLPHVKKQIELGCFKINGFFNSIDLRPVTEEELIYYDSEPERMFRNINRREDLQNPELNS